MLVELSAEELFALYKYDRKFQRVVALRVVRDPKNFLKILMDDIEDALEDLQTKRDLFCKKNVGEDLITTYLVSILRSMGHDATHDTKDGGHVDLTVCNENCGIKWKAEAKIYIDNGYIFKGWQQLTKRYISGNRSDSFSGMLIYCFKGDSKNYLESWLQYLESSEKIIDKTKHSDLRIDTHSILHGSGTQICVRHFMVNLYFPTSNHHAA